MEGAEHYDLAVQLAEEARDRLGRGDTQGALACSAIAQVHATLAGTAARGPDYDQPPITDIRSGMIDEDQKKWLKYTRAAHREVQDLLE